MTNPSHSSIQTCIRRAGNGGELSSDHRNDSRASESRPGQLAADALIGSPPATYDVSAGGWGGGVRQIFLLSKLTAAAEGPPPNTTSTFHDRPCKTQNIAGMCRRHPPSALSHTPLLHAVPTSRPAPKPAVLWPCRFHSVRKQSGFGRFCRGPKKTR